VLPGSDAGRFCRWCILSWGALAGAYGLLLLESEASFAKACKRKPALPLTPKKPAIRAGFLVYNAKGRGHRGLADFFFAP